MTDTQDLYELAHAADPNVCGCAAVAAPRPEWFTVARGDGLVVRLDTATGAAPLQAAIDAVLGADLSAAAVSARALARIRGVAKTLSAAADALPHLVRAELLLMMDEVNLLRARIRAMDAVVANTGTAAMKNAWAALAPVPDRTAGQIKPALLARIDTPDAD